MTGFRKTGIEFNPGYALDPDATGLAVGNFSAKYKKKGDTAFTDVSATWTEENAGTYTFPLTFPSKGQYLVVLSNPTDGLPNIEANYVVNDADIDDVKNAIDAAQSDVTAIKAVTDLLNTTEMEGLSEQIDGVVTQLTNLNAEITTVDGADAITSIKELLIDIQNGGANVDSLLNGQADIRAIVLGDEFLADGTTSNPAYGKGLDEIFDKIVANLTVITDAITVAKDSIETNIADFKTSVEGKVDAVKTVVDANANAIASNGTDIAAVKTVVDGLVTDIAAVGTDTDSIIATLADGTNGLVSIKSTLDSVVSTLATMNGKLDTIGGATSAKFLV
jgi:peptidoglycan hydrolase CwlO-like protein